MPTTSDLNRLTTRRTALLVAHQMWGESSEVSVAPALDGCLNYVHRISTNCESAYVKQALPEPRRADRLRGYIRRVPVRRTQVEVEALGYFSCAASDASLVPNVVSFDPSGNLIVLSDVGQPDHRLLDYELAEGCFARVTASIIGEFLGRCHNPEINIQRPFWGTQSDDESHWRRCLDARMSGLNLASAHARARAQDVRTASIEAVQRGVLISNDVCPKNIVVRQDGLVGFVDFELTSSVGDPAIDLGFMLGHYLLWGSIKDQTRAAFEAVETALSSYEDVSPGRLTGRFVARFLGFAGVTMFYRLSGVDVCQDRYRCALDSAEIVLSRVFHRLDDAREALASTPAA